MSWTLDRGIAQVFYGRWLTTMPEGLYQATVPAKAILGRLDSRDEAEAIIHPNMLRGRIELLAVERPNGTRDGS